VQALSRRLTAEVVRVDLLSASPCGSHLAVLVAVADSATIRYLKQQFGRSLLISGWLAQVPT